MSSPINTAGLEPYAPALDRRRLAHLMRRAAFGASTATIDEHLGKTATDVVDVLVAAATNTSILPNPPRPTWADSAPPDRKTAPVEVVKAYNENNLLWLAEYRANCVSWLQQGALREKMTLFWHNHFVTQSEVYELAVFAHRYVELLREHCLGNFKTMVHDVGLTPAMLIYLNGDLNEKDRPNENYARELLELFTMSPQDADGNPNYSQTDVEELARALTGWKVDEQAIAIFYESKEFDAGSKTILGRTGNYDYAGVIDVIFEERTDQVAYFVCWNLYREFVYEQADRSIVEQLANILVANDFEILPVIDALLKSAHFFSDEFIGARIKSPFSLTAGLMADTGTIPALETLAGYSESFDQLGQTFLDPPDVAGWRGFRAWLSTDSLPARWAFSETLLTTAADGQPIDTLAFASGLPYAADVLSAFKLPLSIAEHLMSVALEQLPLYDVEEDFEGDLVGNPIPPEILAGPEHAITLAKVFLGGVPWYEWSVFMDGADGVIADYIRFLMNLPEFQLT